MTERAALKHYIAMILDHPSVYMGGPSRQSQDKAERILAHLEKCGVLHTGGEREDQE